LERACPCDLPGGELMSSATPYRRRRPLVGRGVHPLSAAGLAAVLVPATTNGEDKPAQPQREPWKTSRVVGSPDPPPPFKVVRAFPNLKFNHPLLITRPPGS